MAIILHTYLAENLPSLKWHLGESHESTHLHAKWLVRGQCMQMVEIWFSEDYSILGGGAPCLHKVDGIATPEGRMAGEHHTGGLVHRPQVAMEIGKVFQTTAADELERNVCVHRRDKRKFISLTCLLAKKASVESSQTTQKTVTLTF